MFFFFNQCPETGAAVPLQGRLKINARGANIHKIMISHHSYLLQHIYAILREFIHQI